MKSKLLITCPKGVELVLEDEVLGFGADNVRQTVGGIFCEADLAQIYHICLWSRFANKVIWILDEKKVTSTDEFYKVVRDIAWTSCFSVSKTFAVDFKGTNRYIKHSNYGALLVKDAIVDCFNAEVGERPDVSPKQADVRVYAQVKHDYLLFGIDMSGGSLHKRGYRLDGAMAPLKENLAAALVKRANVVPDDARLFVDPMCGSGTLLIEAVMMKLNIAPGLQRPVFGFENLLKHQRAVWQEKLDVALDMRDTAIAATEDVVLATGYDRDSRVIAAAQQNVDRAGLSGCIKFKPQSLVDFAPSADIDKALLLSNPPYGERLDQRNELFSVYQLLGQKIRQYCQGWQAAVLSSDDFLLKALSLQKSKLYKFYNGTLQTEWVLFDIYKKDTSKRQARGNETKETDVVQHSISDATALSDNLAEDNVTDSANIWQQAAKNRKTNAVEPRDDMPEVDLKDQRFLQGVEMVANRLRKNQKRLKKWIKQNDIHAYRIYDADMPEYAMALDYYGGQYQVTEYAAPKTVDAFAAYQRKQQFEQAVCDVFDLTKKQLVIKERKQQKGKSQYERVDETKHFFKVKEGNGLFYINLHDYLDTGLFLDHRPVRLKIAELAKGKRFLNLFAYTSAATVHAALGGATRSVSVDMSQTYQAWSERNFKANRMNPQLHRLERANCMEWLATAKQSEERYDLIFLDPPSFSNSKRMEGTLDIQRDHGDMISKTMDVMADDGLLIFSNNLRGFSLDNWILEQYEVENISKQSIDKDFERNQKIHQCWLIRKVAGQG